MLADWNWQKTDLNVHNALFLGEAARLAYQEEADVETTLDSWKMRKVKFFDCNETQAYLTQNNEACILAFRGTQPDKVADWLKDLDATQIPGPSGKVHRGFWLALNDVWDDISKTLKANRGPRTLWVTGHSLGGALAVLAATRLRMSGQTVNGLYTYGQPRVGDDKFCQNFDKGMGAVTFRFVNYKDIVPRVPLPTMQYGDLGKFQYFNEQQWLPTTTWADVLLHSLGTTVKEMLELVGVEDHRMENYIPKLQALANRDVMHGH